jgi:hypothetical protein
MSEITIDFGKMDGLAPAIVQDAKTLEVLMVGFLNETSYAKTLETGFVTFWSRTRQKLWRARPAVTACGWWTPRPIAIRTPCFFGWRSRAMGWFAMKARSAALRGRLR